MHRARPARLKNFPYVGKYRYSLRFATANRVQIFSDASIARGLIEQILKTSDDEKFAVLAYCVMPDHVHLVVEGTTRTSDLRRFAKITKQRTEYELRKNFRIGGFWQHGYYERVLRSSDATAIAIDYVLHNPVAAGLVTHRRDYPFSGGTRAR